MHHAHCTISRPPRVRACAELRRRRHLASVLGHPQGLPPPPAAHGARSPPALDHQSRGRVLEARTSNGGSTTGTRPDKIEEKNRRPRGRARHVRGALRSAVKFEIACIRAPGLARGAPSRRAPCGWRCVGSGLSFCVRPKAVGTACPEMKLYFFRVFSGECAAGSKGRRGSREIRPSANGVVGITACTGEKPVRRANRVVDDGLDVLVYGPHVAVGWCRRRLGRPYAPEVVHTSC